MELDLTEILNKKGFFFQKYCAQKIKESAWIVDIEEYPISEKESFDIKANLILFETALNIAVIECKRQDPTRKRWVFYRKEPAGSKMQDFLIQTHNLATFRGSFLQKAKVSRAVYEGLNESKLGFPACHTIGLEIFKDEKNNNWKANSEVVHKSCLIVAKGINHLFDSEAERLSNNIRVGLKRLENDKKKYGWTYFYGGTLIPVVITSAPIFSLTFDPNTMDIKTFMVHHDEANYAEKEWIVYEFPLPQELRYQSRESFKLIGENRYAKMHTFIVNGRYITKFFNSLAESLKTCYEKSNRALEVEFSEYYKPKSSRF